MVQVFVNNIERIDVCFMLLYERGYCCIKGGNVTDEQTVNKSV